MRNIFDQYSQPENRLTHALVSALYHDKTLLNNFLKEFSPAHTPPPGQLQIIEQGLPGKVELDEGEAVKQGLPDGLIFNDEGWALIIESKISSGLTKDQLRRHSNTVSKCGYDQISGLTITVDRPSFTMPDWQTVSWKDIYSWGHRHKQTSPWAKLMVEYFDVAEAKMAQDEYLTEGTITEFSGISFNPYTYLECKRVLRLFMKKLRGNQRFVKAMGIDETDPGRSSITRQENLWDFLRLKHPDSQGKPFQGFPHCSIGIGPEIAGASITFPNGMKGPLRRRLAGESFEEFAGSLSEAASAIEKNLKGLKGYKPVARLLQRRFESQRSIPYRDGVIEFDPRVITGRDKPQFGPPIKRQQGWARATYDLLSHRRSNMQFQIGVEFYHADYDELATKNADKYFIAVFTALKPFLDRVID